MDLTHLTPTTAAGKPPPESESETPPAKFHPSKPTSFNGVLKRLAPPSLVSLKYKECLKNHAATMGGHALDGCGEFMSSATATSGNPTSLKCAACGCHRNFHRRDPEFDSPIISPILEYHPHHRHHPPPPPTARGSQSPPPISSAYFAGAGSGPHMLLGLALSEPSRRKRFRTKFSHEQKEKMLEFAEKIGWKMQKINDEMVRRFCSEIGVERGVFKVWMHNNKSASAKRVAGSTDPSERNGIRNGNEGNSHSSSIEQQDQDQDHDHNHDHQCNGKSNAATNASSSSS